MAGAFAGSRRGGGVVRSSAPRALSEGRVDGGGGDLSSSRRDSVGDRVGRVADGVDDRGEVRDRLDHRFKLLVGSRRGLERHQTLRHAVAWSYDLLDDDEKALLERCSVFAGGFDLQSACAVAGLRRCRRVRDSGSARRAGAQVAARRRPVVGADPVLDAGDDPPVRRGATVARGDVADGPHAHARYFAGSEPKSWRCGTAPASARRTRGSPPNWPICVPRFGGPPTTATSTRPLRSRTSLGLLDVDREL